MVAGSPLSEALLALRIPWNGTLRLLRASSGHPPLSRKRTVAFAPVSGFDPLRSAPHEPDRTDDGIVAKQHCEIYVAAVLSEASFATIANAMLIGYARVSTIDQKLDLQVDALRRSGCEKMFSDIVNGVRANRDGLREALSHLRPGDTLVVWKLDRLGRTVRQLLDFVEDLSKAQIGLRSLTDGIDTSTPSGRFFFHVMAALAEMERDLLRERTRAGLAAARARGRNGGRPSKLTGKQVAHAKRLLADPATTVGEVAATLGVSRSTLYRTFKRSGEAAHI
ncbi:recombinase family protein [Methylobacterium segetis]|uniref:recombinase family protein n=1 Tax=Methylobacterium segetis TaxID=2488750 RepID=UPI003CCAD24C